MQEFIDALVAGDIRTWIFLVLGVLLLSLIIDKLSKLRAKYKTAINLLLFLGIGLLIYSYLTYPEQTTNAVMAVVNKITIVLGEIWEGTSINKPSTSLETIIIG